MEKEEEKMYTPIQVGEITQQSMATIYRHIKSGKLKTTEFGRLHRITQDDLREYIKGVK